MKGKPIEPGCLAITTGSVMPENTGKIVTVTGLNKQLTSPECRVWDVRFNHVTRMKHAGKIIQCDTGHIPEVWLRRIDDGDDTGIDSTIDRELEVTA